jgi:hypothetical protein
VLESRCFECHGPDLPKVKGGLRFSSSAEFLRGGTSGPPIDLEHWQESLLVQAIRRTDPDLAMPPRTALSEAERAVLERWVELGAPWPAERAVDPELAREFEDEVRPLLALRCFECHGPTVAAPKSGLRMSGRKALLAGGVHGPALVPGDANASLLLRAVNYEHPSLHMPPTRRLPAAEIEVLRRWIEHGAYWPAHSAATQVEGAEPAAGIDWERAREWWSFRPVERPALPPAAAADEHPIDAFVDARLAAAGITPNPEASARELVRRAYYDLLGLPPTLAEIEAYAQDSAPRAFERLVDRLLERPEYGERMARRWLDLVRYAQTNGYERDSEKPYAWRYRDWVVRAFQRDQPFDRFARDQIAGDEIDGPRSPSAIGTGLYRIGPWDDEPDDAVQAVHDELDDIVRVVGEGFLGITIGCARCHDHKFDPLTQADYYGLVAYVRNVEPYAAPELSGQSPTLAPIGASYEQVRQWHTEHEQHLTALRTERGRLLSEARTRHAEQVLADLPAAVRAAFAVAAEARAPAELELVAAHGERDYSDVDALAVLSAQSRRRAIDIDLELSAPAGGYAGGLNWALVAKTRAEALPTHVLARGRAGSPGARVVPAAPRVLRGTDQANAAMEEPAVDPLAASTDQGIRAPGSRLALAEWITSAQNPLTARVWVNRLWQQLYGRGIASTVSDFGKMGTPPTHPELLDWLASEFVARDWSTKALQRLLMSSRAYRRSALQDNRDGVDKDPSNALWWRQIPQRLDAESVHDSMLLVSGQLNPERGGRGYFPQLSREVLGGASRPGEGWEVSPLEQRSRRALYAYAKRGVRPALIDGFDGADPSLSVGVRASTTTATQALVLLNGDFSAEQAEATAQRVLVAAGPHVSSAALAAHAFERVLARMPTAEESALASSFVDAQARALAQLPARLSFRPRVPTRLSRGYLARASGADLQYGPRSGWSFVSGVWGNLYNDTLESDLDRGPAALWNGPATGPLGPNLRFSARLRPSAGNEIASLYLRARVVETWLAGIELRCEPAAGRVSLWQVEKQAVKLGECALEWPAGAALSLAIELDGKRCTVRLGGAAEPQLVVEDERLYGSGSLGARAVGESFEFEDPRVECAGVAIDLGASERRDPLALGLESLCLALFNTNEFLYRD